VYDAERELFPVDKYPPDLSLWECEQLLHRMYRDTRYREMEKAKKGAPVLKDGRGRRRAGYSRPRHAIALPRYYRKAWVVAHEVAHTFVDHNRVPGHGAEFMAVYIDLLERHCGMDGLALVKYFTERGVRVCAFEEVTAQKATALAA
jgi:putative metallohydrolase (TIGR04338 family)